MNKLFQNVVLNFFPICMNFSVYFVYKPRALCVF